MPTGRCPHPPGPLAILPWALRYEWQGIQLEDYPYVKDYIERLTARPAIQKALSIKVG